MHIAGVESHRNCLLCGDLNQFGLKLKFCADKNGEVSALFKARTELQGYNDIMHGGVISALLDSAMTNCLFKSGIEAVTGDLHVRYLMPVPCHAELIIKAWIISRRPPLFRLKSELIHDNRTMAWAEAKFIQRTKRIEKCLVKNPMYC